MPWPLQQCVLCPVPRETRAHPIQQRGQVHPCVGYDQADMFALVQEGTREVRVGKLR